MLVYRMHSFSYKNGTLHCEDTSLDQLAKTHGTPLYVYSKATLLDHYQRLDEALAPLDHLICYAVKANSNIAVLNTLAEAGSGFDIVSGGELYRVLKAKGKAGRCTFAGVGKTQEEIETALNEGIYSFNVESEAEIEFINEIAGRLGRKAPIALRVNPNVDAQTHKYISTGKSENKFGIDFERIPAAYEAASKLPNLELRGIQTHIGSQLTSVKPFIEAVEKLVPLVQSLKDKYGLEFFSIGGGIGIVYDESLASGNTKWWDNHDEPPMTVERYASSLVPLLEPLKMRILVEPGRFIAGNAGALITKCLYEKKGKAKTFRIIDSGMNDLIRPALYEGYHQIAPVTEPSSEEGEAVDVVGPICETGDFFCQDRVLPPFGEGDLISILSAGAYGFVMASNYNSRPFPAEILVDGEKSHLVRKRQTLDDLISSESIPT